MAYGVKYYCDHKTQVGGSETTARVEILEDGYSGSATEVRGTGDVYRREYERLSRREPFKNPILGGRMEFVLLVEGPSQLQILQDIFAADAEKYRMRLKIGGSVAWTGKVQTGLLDYSEDGYPFEGVISAKDLSPLDSPASSFGLQGGAQTIIQTISAILKKLGYGLQIATYTNWEYAAVAGGDYLAKITHILNNLREFGGEDPDTPITDWQALEWILRAHMLHLWQSGGMWHLRHVSALKNPQAVARHLYDQDGVLVSSGNVDLRSNVDRTSRFILPSTRNIVLPALRQVRTRFVHRTRIATLTLPSKVTIQQNEADKSYTYNNFISDGSQAVHLSAYVLAYQSAGVTGEVDVQIRHGNRYYTGSTWSTTAQDIRTPLERGPDDQWVGSFSINTAPIPAGTGDLIITLRKARTRDEGGVGGGMGDPTNYTDIGFEILNPATQPGDTTAIVKTLTQTGDYLGHYDHGDVYFGDGPTAYSYARLSTITEGRTDGRWRFKGGSAEWDFHELGLKEILCWQRTAVRTLSGELWGAYEPHQVAIHEGGGYLFLGGVQTGRENTWSADWAKIQHSDQVSDDFQERYETSDPGRGGGGGGGGGSPAPGTTTWGSIIGKPSSTSQWATETGFDDRYFRRDFNLSEGNPATMRSNLGLGALAVLDQVDTPHYVDGSVTNAKLQNSTISGVALGGNLFSHTAGDGLSGDSYNGVTARTWAVVPSAPVAIIAGKVGLNYTDPLTVAGGNLAVKLRAPVTLSDGQIGLNRNDPLYLNGSNLDIRDHADGQRGVLSPESQVIYGEKLFDADIGSPEWISQLLGWRMTEDGHLDTRSGRFGEIITQSFISDTTISRAGSDFLSESNAQLSEDFEIGSQENLQWQWEISWDSLLDNYETWADSEGATDYDEIKTRLLFQSLYSEGLDRQWESGDDFMSESYERSVMVVDEHPGQDGFAVFENGHWIRLRAQQRDGGLRFQDFWCRVWWPDAYLEYEEYADWADDNGANSVDEEKTRQLFSALYETPQLFNGDGTQSYQVEFVYPKPVDPIVFRAGSVVLSYGLPGQVIIERSAMGTPFDRAFAWHDRPWKEELYEILWNLGDGSASGGTPGEMEVFIRDVFRTEFENGSLRIGSNADGQGNPGFYIDENNYFLLNRGFKATLEGNFVQTDNIIASINASPEGVAIAGNRIELTGDTSIDGSFSVTGANITLDSNVTIDGSFKVSGGNVHITSDTVFDADVVIRGTLDGVDGTFSGTLSGVAANFDSGKIGGFDIDDGDLVGPNVGLASSGTWRMWSGSNSPSTAPFRVRNDGRVYSNAFGQVVFAKEHVATTATNNDLGTITDEWHNRATRSTDGTTTVPATKIIAVFTKRNGLDTIRGSFWARRVTSGLGTAFPTYAARIILSAGGSSANVFVGGEQWYTVELDISGFSTGDTVTLEMKMEAEVTISESDGNTHTTDLYVRQDAIIETIN